MAEPVGMLARCDTRLGHSRSWRLVLSFLVLSFLWQVSPGLPAPLAAHEIAILTSADIPAYAKAVQGFKAAVSPRWTLSDYDLDGSIARGRAQARKIRASGADLVLAVGLKAALVAKLEILDTPVIFCMVIDPAEHGLPAPNMVGVLLTVPSSPQLAAMRSVLPDLHRVGVLYDTERTGAFVSDARQQAQALGLTLLTSEVDSDRGIPDALRALLPKIDALWLIRDQTVVTEESINFILGTALDHSIPVFAFSAGLVRHGALAALSVDYVDAGRQAGDLAREILRRGSSAPGPPQLQPPSQPQLALNLNVAEFLSLPTPIEVLKLADTLYGGTGMFARKDPTRGKRDQTEEQDGPVLLR